MQKILILFMSFVVGMISITPADANRRQRWIIHKKKEAARKELEKERKEQEKLLLEEKNKKDTLEDSSTSKPTELVRLKVIKPKSNN